MKTHIMRYLAGFAVCALLLGGLCLGGGAAASAAGSTLSLTAADKALLESSYQSLCGRLTERGYAQTSLTGAYNGMFVRDASIQAMAHLSRGDDEYARRLLEYMVRYHEELDMDYTVRAVAPLTDDAYGNTNAGTSSVPQNDGKNGFYADGTPTALYQTKAPNNRCAFTIVPSVSSVHSIRLYMNAAADTTVYLTDSYTGDLAAARGKATGGTGAGTGWKTFTFSKAVSVTPGKAYTIVVQTAAGGTGGVVYGSLNAGESYNYDGGWSTKSHAVWFGLNPAESGTGSAALDKETVLTFGKGAAAGQVLPAKVTGNNVVTAVRVVLGKKSGAAGNVVATLYKGKDEKGQKINTALVAADKLTAAGDWVTFAFSLPAGGTQSGDSYYLTLEAPDAKADSVVWYGKKSENLCVTTRRENGSTQTVTGDGYYDCRKSTIAPADSMIQVDAHYMLLHSWCLYMERAKDCAEKTAFFRESWPTIKKFANYFVKDHAAQYLHSTYSLVINPNFEHTLHMMRTMDLMTNCFTSQALHELSGIAVKQGEKALSAEWKTLADRIAAGVNKYMIVKSDTLNREPVYADRLDMDYSDNRAVPVFSFVCYAPVAAEWYAADEKAVANTYTWHRLLGSCNFNGIAMPDIYYPYDELACRHQSHGNSPRVHGRGNHVVGRMVGYELLYNSQVKDVGRLTELLRFLRKNSDKVYAEVWKTDGSKQDVGNQEQVSWIVYGLMTAQKRLAAGQSTTTASRGGNTTSTASRPAADPGGVLPGVSGSTLPAGSADADSAPDTDSGMPSPAESADDVSLTPGGDTSTSAGDVPAEASEQTPEKAGGGLWILWVGIAAGVLAIAAAAALLLRRRMGRKV